MGCTSGFLEVMETSLAKRSVHVLILFLDSIYTERQKQNNNNNKKKKKKKKKRNTCIFRCNSETTENILFK